MKCCFDKLPLHPYNILLIKRCRQRKPPSKSSEGDSTGKETSTPTTSVLHSSYRQPGHTPLQLHPRAHPSIPPRHQPPPAGSKPRGKEILHTTRYCMPDLDDNGIDGKDLSTFGQHNWASLRQLHICTLLHEVDKNNLGPVGCGYLSRAEIGGI